MSVLSEKQIMSKLYLFLFLGLVFASAQESTGSDFPFFKGLNLPKLKLPDINFFIKQPVLPVLPDILNLFKQLADLKTHPQRGTFEYNTSLYEQLLHTCEEMRHADQDFQFYKSVNVCPNMTDLLIQSGGLSKSSVDIILDAAVAALSLFSLKQECDQKTNQLSKTECYLNILPPGLKDLMMLLSSAKDMIIGVRRLLILMQVEWKFCQDYNKLNQTEKTKYRDAWKNEMTTCSERAKEIMTKPLENDKLNASEVTTRSPVGRPTGVTRGTTGAPKGSAVGPTSSPSLPASNPSDVKPSEAPRNVSPRSETQRNETPRSITQRNETSFIKPFTDNLKPLTNIFNYLKNNINF